MAMQKKRVLILGGGGMLGHKMWQVFQNHFDCYVTLRGPYDDWMKYWPYKKEKTLDHINAFSIEDFSRIIKDLQPDTIINCIGIVKQLEESQESIASITVNALFPHRIASLCQKHSIRFIHISTDCVFSGKKGNYQEDDFSDAEDLYGRTKYLGEVQSPHLTLRTSIIGHELKRHTSLLDWFFQQAGGKIKGYTRAIYSGFPTVVFSEIVAEIISQFPDLKGCYHVASCPIDKYTLLLKLKEAFNLAIDIEPYDDYQCDRSLNADRFLAETGYSSFEWDALIAKMVDDERFYKEWRQ